MALPSALVGILLLAVPCLIPEQITAQVIYTPYAFTNFAGVPGGLGNADGMGSAAEFDRPYGMAVDNAGNVYVADSSNHTIRKVTPAGAVTTFAGLAGQSGFADGVGNAARFYGPSGVAVDTAGNIYVADTYNRTIRKITPAGAVSTLAGSPLYQGSADGTGSAARFYDPANVAVDNAGNVYVADEGNSTIRKVSAAGVVTTLAGQPEQYGATDGAGPAARFYLPYGVAVDGAGNVYVADTYNQTVRKITAAGTVTTLAGLAGQSGSTDGTGSAARFGFPMGVAADSSGNIYVTDSSNDTIRRITPSGAVTTLAGLAGTRGGTDGIGSSARFNNPYGLAVDGAGTIYVTDTDNGTIRKITPAGAVTTLAGKAPQPGSDDGPGSTARFIDPRGVAADSAGNVYVADTFGDTVRKISPAGIVTTLAGLATQQGSADGTGTAARFNQPNGVAVDSAGNTYVADSYNFTIRKITPGGLVTTLAGLAGQHGSADGTGSAARFYVPSSVAVDTVGNVYVADVFNDTIRKITPGGAVTTLAGLAGQYGNLDGAGSAARFGQPYGVAVDGAGYVYVADSYNHTIRKITPSGTVTTLAGTAGTSGSADGTGSAARFYRPWGVAIDVGGNVYVADSGNNTIRKITAGGVVTTLAGLAGSSGRSDGTGGAARFSTPYSVGTDSNGNVYAADSDNYTIRRINSSGAVTTLAGLAGQQGSTDGSNAVAAHFTYPYGVAVDNAGITYVADFGNSTIRKITPAGVTTTLAGSVGLGGSTDGTGSAARFKFPSGVAADSAGYLYVADKGNSTIRKITPAGVVTTLAGLAGQNGSTDGTGSAARFYSPFGIAVDSPGNVYVADQGNHTIRKVTPAGLVTTLAGLAGQSGTADGAGSLARFSRPSGIAVDGGGNVYVADSDNVTIRKITPTGFVSTLAGLAGQAGSTDATGSAARFSACWGVAVDSLGNIYVSDTYNHSIRRITSAGAVTTLAGFAAHRGSHDGIGSAARFYYPGGIAVDSTGNIYVADSENNRITKGTPLLQFDSIARSPAVQNGLFNARLIGPSSNRFVLEATTDFVTWTPIQTNSLPAGSLDLSAPVGANQHRFFRALLAP